MRSLGSSGARRIGAFVLVVAALGGSSALCAQTGATTSTSPPASGPGSGTPGAASTPASIPTRATMTLTGTAKGSPSPATATILLTLVRQDPAATSRFVALPSLQPGAPGGISIQVLSASLPPIAKPGGAAASANGSTTNYILGGIVYVGGAAQPGTVPPPGNGAAPTHATPATGAGAVPGAAPASGGATPPPPPTIPPQDNSVAQAKADSFAIDSLIRNTGIWVQRYGSVGDVKYRDSLFYSGASAILTNPADPPSRSVWFLPLPDLGFADSMVATVLDGGSKNQARLGLWRAQPGMIGLFQLYGNLKHLDEDAFIYTGIVPAIGASICANRWMGTNRQLDPIPPGELPPERTAALVVSATKGGYTSALLQNADIQIDVLRNGRVIERKPILGRGFARVPPCNDGEERTTESWTLPLGAVPLSDSSRVVIRVRDRSDTLMVWRQDASEFGITLSAGTVAPLNGTGTGSSNFTARLGVTGRVVIATMDPRWSGHDWTLGATNRFLTGPVTVEGDLLLATNVASKNTSSSTGTTVAKSLHQSGIVARDGAVALTCSDADPNSPPLPQCFTYGQSTEAALRATLPLIDFGRRVAIRGFAEATAVDLQSSTSIFGGFYYGFRLAVDSVQDGRQSYIEYAWGKSDELVPSHGRRRATIQFRIPSTPLFIQYRNNSTGASGPTSVEQSVLSVFVALPASTVFSVLGQGSGSAKAAVIGNWAPR